MTWEIFGEFVKIFGLPITMCFVAIWAFATNRVITKGQYQEMLQEKDKQIADAQVSEAEMWGILKVQFKITDVVTSELEQLKRPTRR